MIALVGAGSAFYSFPKLSECLRGYLRLPTALPFLRVGERNSWRASWCAASRGRLIAEPAHQLAGAWYFFRGSATWTVPAQTLFQDAVKSIVKSRVATPRNQKSRHGSKAGYSLGKAGIDARRATPPDPTPPRRGAPAVAGSTPGHPAVSGNHRLGHAGRRAAMPLRALTTFCPSWGCLVG